MSRPCSSLCKDEIVIFLCYNDIYNKKIPTDGNVIYVDYVRHEVCVCYLDGYKSESDFIPYEDMIAVHDPEGEQMSFDHISGPSQLLTAD